MNRRIFLATAAASVAAATLSTPLLAQARPPKLTQWNVIES